MPPSPYTHDRLNEAARSSRTLSQALVKLGVDPRSGSRRYLRARMRTLGIDTSHFEREGARWTREILEPAVAASTNMNEVLRRLGLGIVGGHHTHISNRVRALGIDTSHFTARTSGNRAGRRRRTPEDVLVEQNPESARRVHGDRLRQCMLDAGVAHLCALCGMEPMWRGRRLPLEVDHIDGRWWNNRLQNLRLLCPNCHATTDTYRGRNKGPRDTRDRHRSTETAS
ncbi:HNH endonuclease signature motif containing protein [Streptomyces xinghaiensis]|uniref:HNH endonuclease signature motif containing protein n=1 Tax=Streptomyces xinghaiensis TaxID=1038928 RepID=UPI0005842F7B|nr:HNH endonuclease signature motif containing protein [Streptomyces xinghaiensis]MZE78643.1 HNH endonuclease [Streptomyces sp. SID5475]